MTKESVTDKPVTRVSLKERLENMKQKVAGMDKHEKVRPASYSQYLKDKK